MNEWMNAAERDVPTIILCIVTGLISFQLISLSFPQPGDDAWLFQSGLWQFSRRALLDSEINSVASEALSTSVHASAVASALLSVPSVPRPP